MVALCGRRAGKTVTAAAACAWALHHADFDEDVVYGARTRKVAKGLIWGKLKRLIETQGYPWKVNESDLTISTDKGATLHVVGFDKEAEIEKLRGMKMRLFVADEPATYSHLLGALFRDIVDPALGDVRGSVLLCGTPGHVCTGPWYDASCGESRRWRVHHWTIRENPHFPQAEKYLWEVLEENGWDETTITYRREYLAEWVSDESVLVYRYAPSRNLVDAAPETHVHTIGVDFGMVDECAWTVWGSPRYSRDVYALYSSKRQGLLPEEAAEQTAALCSRWNPDVLVGDAGGLGKPYVVAFNRRYGDALNTFMQNAEKSEKRAHIELLNNDLMSPRAYLVGGDADPLADEWAHLPWKNESRREEHDAYPNHCSDSALYGWRHHSAYLAEKAPEPEPKLTPDSEEWIRREAEQLQREAEREWWDQ